jgi:hypothetical protein
VVLDEVSVAGYAKISSSLDVLVELGRPALAISPVEIEVFIEAEICGAGRVTSRQPGV